MPAGIKDNSASSPPHGRVGPWHSADSAFPVRMKMLESTVAANRFGGMNEHDNQQRHGTPCVIDVRDGGARGRVIVPGPSRDGTGGGDDPGQAAWCQPSRRHDLQGHSLSRDDQRRGSTAVALPFCFTVVARPSFFTEDDRAPRRTTEGSLCSCWRRWGVSSCSVPSGQNPDHALAEDLIWTALD